MNNGNGATTQRRGLTAGFRDALATNAGLIRNELMLRIEALRRWLDPYGRKIDMECGHPELIQTLDYKYQYERGDISKRIIHLYPEESWSQIPSIYETEDPEETQFEKAWKLLNEQHNLMAILLRADILSGIGRFGVIVLGIDDGEQLLEPLDGIDLETGRPKGNPTPHQLLYARPLQEAYVQIHALNADVTNPRYGQPEVYQLHFLNSVLGNQNMVAMRAHWTRIIHLCDNRTDSEVFGEPRLKVIYDRILDLHKVCGGSAEMFWKGGFPGLSLESQPAIGEDVTLDHKHTSEQMEEYMTGLRRYIATVGMNVKSLSTEVADPDKHIDAQLKLIATALAIPWRVFVGSEAAKLASNQDVITWNRRLTRRREDYLNPFVIRPFVDRLIDVGVLPKPTMNDGRYMIDWEDLAAPSDSDKATVAKDRTMALFQYVTGGIDQLIPPFHYLHDIMGLDEDEANAILDAANDQMGDMDSHGVVDGNPLRAPFVPPVGAPTGLGIGVAPFQGGGSQGPGGIGVRGDPAPNPKDSGKLQSQRFPITGASPV